MKIRMRVDEKHETIEHGFKVDLHPVNAKGERLYDSFFLLNAKSDPDVRDLPIGAFVEVTVTLLAPPLLEATQAPEDVVEDAAQPATV